MSLVRWHTIRLEVFSVGLLTIFKPDFEYTGIFLYLVTSSLIMFLFSLVILVLSSVSAADQWYTMFPANMQDGPVNDRIRQRIIDEIGGDKVHHSHSTALGGHLYWYALLSDQFKQFMDTFEGVCHLYRNKLTGMKS